MGRVAARSAGFGPRGQQIGGHIGNIAGAAAAANIAGVPTAVQWTLYGDNPVNAADLRPLQHPWRPEHHGVDASALRNLMGLANQYPAGAAQQVEWMHGSVPRGFISSGLQTIGYSPNIRDPHALSLLRSTVGTGRLPAVHMDPVLPSTHASYAPHRRPWRAYINAGAHPGVDGVDNVVVGPLETLMHEYEHHRQGPFPLNALNNNRQLTPAAEFAYEFPPSLADIPRLAEIARRQTGRSWSMPVPLTGAVMDRITYDPKFHHDLEWMRRMAEQYGLFSGRSSTELLGGTPSGRAYTKRLLRLPAQAALVKDQE